MVILFVLLALLAFLQPLDLLRAMRALQVLCVAIVIQVAIFANLELMHLCTHALSALQVLIQIVLVLSLVMHALQVTLLWQAQPCAQLALQDIIAPALALFVTCPKLLRDQ